MLIRSYVAGWSACRLVWAASIATAQLAILDRTLSARLVRMIGTRAPRTTPALSALARKLSCLARMFPATGLERFWHVRAAGRRDQAPLR